MHRAVQRTPMTYHTSATPGQKYKHPFSVLCTLSILLFLPSQAHPPNNVNILHPSPAQTTNNPNVKMVEMVTMVTMCHS
jgi:hypothetical protein